MKQPDSFCGSRRVRRIVAPDPRMRISAGEMHATVFRAAETPQGPASRGLPEQFRLQPRGVYRARASFQNRKFGTLAATPTSGAGGEEGDPSGVESRARRRSHGQPRESDGPFQGLLLWRGSTPAGRGLGLPSGEGHTERSLPARASKARIELVMLGFPIPRANLNRLAGIESLESQRRQFILCTLVGAHKTLQVGFDCQALVLGSGAQLGFQFRMDGDAHARCPRPSERNCNSPFRGCHCLKSLEIIFRSSPPPRPAPQFQLRSDTWQTVQIRACERSP